MNLKQCIDTIIKLHKTYVLKAKAYIFKDDLREVEKELIKVFQSVDPWITMDDITTPAYWDFSFDSLYLKIREIGIELCLTCDDRLIIRNTSGDAPAGFYLETPSSGLVGMLCEDLMHNLLTYFDIKDQLEGSSTFSGVKHRVKEIMRKYAPVKRQYVTAQGELCTLLKSLQGERLFDHGECFCLQDYNWASHEIKIKKLECDPLFPISFIYEERFISMLEEALKALD